MMLFLHLFPAQNEIYFRFEFIRCSESPFFLFWFSVESVGYQKVGLMYEIKKKLTICVSIAVA